MKTTVVSYSLTGNNRLLAASVAQKLGAEHISVAENGRRSMGRIVLDLLLGRTPRVRPAPDTLGRCGLVVLAGPVWIGQIATPLRAYCRWLKKTQTPFAFVSISGGADGPNPKLTDELTRRAGHAPLKMVDLHIADLLPREPKPERKDTSAYRLSGKDLEALTAEALRELGGLTDGERAK